MAVVSQREEPAFPLRRARITSRSADTRTRTSGARSIPTGAAAVARAIDDAEVGAFADRTTDELSGGEWQRVRIARALAQDARALVLDEPTTYLDIAHEMAAFELLDELARRGQAILVVSHQLNLVARFAHRVVLLHRGTVAAAGAPADVMRGDVLERVYDWPLVVTRDPAVGRSCVTTTAGTAEEPNDTAISDPAQQPPQQSASVPLAFDDNACCVLSSRRSHVLSAPLVAQQPKDTTVLHPVVITATRVPIDQTARASVGDRAFAATTFASRGIVDGERRARVGAGPDGRAQRLVRRDDVAVRARRRERLREGARRRRSAQQPGWRVRFRDVSRPTTSIASRSFADPRASRTDRTPSPASFSCSRGAASVRRVASLDLRGGTFGTMEGERGVAGGNVVVGYSLGASSRETDGIAGVQQRLPEPRRERTPDVHARRDDDRPHGSPHRCDVSLSDRRIRRGRRQQFRAAEIIGRCLVSRRRRHLTSRVDLRLLGAASRLDGGSTNDPDSPGDTTGFYSRDDSRIERRSADLRADVHAGEHATLSFGGAVEREQARNTSDERSFRHFPATTDARSRRIARTRACTRR